MHAMFVTLVNISVEKIVLENCDADALSTLFIKGYIITT